MKLYNGMSPNGFRVTAFLAEKGMEVPTVEVSPLQGDTRKPEHFKRNSLGEIPVLELDDGSFLTESIAICRYLEELHPEPALFGKTPEERARVEMWNRRMEQQIMQVIGAAGLHEIPFFAEKVEQMPEYAASQRRAFAKKLEWLDSEFSDGREYVAGDNFSVADITGMAALMICRIMKQDVPASLKYIKQWQDKVQQRGAWPS